jgi:hypothetical protein
VSSPSSSKQSGGARRKPKLDVYTVVLAIALLALLIGVGSLLAIILAHSNQSKGGGALSSRNQSVFQVPAERETASASEETALRSLPKALRNLEIGVRMKKAYYVRSDWPTLGCDRSFASCG